MSKLTQEEIETLSRPTSIKEIESMNSLPKHKALGPEGLTSEFYQRIKEEMISIFYDVFQRIEAKGILPNSF